MNTFHLRTLSFTLLTFFLVACGGGPTSTTNNTAGSNNPPLINAGANFSAEVGVGVTLAGSASDSDGDALSTTWSFTSVPTGSTATLTNSNQLDATFTPDLVGTYTVELMATDGTDQASGTVTVTVSTPFSGGTYIGTVPAAQVGATVVGLTIEELSGADQTSVPVTFGQVFSPGEIPTDTLIAVRLADGTQSLLPSQVTKKATHADGSLRHAVITTRIPSMAANSQQDIEIVVVDSVSAAQSVKLADLLATNFDGVVTLTVAGIDYTVSIADLLTTTQSKTWLSGSEVTEWMVSAPLKAADGTEHPHLTARFNIRAYASFDSVRVDVIIENNWSYVIEPQNFIYDVNVSLCGNNVYNKIGLTHYHHARWRKTFWCGNEPAVHIKHDVGYLIDSYAVPNYDRSLVVPESDLTSMKTKWTGTKIEPMGVGVANGYMPGTGARPDIGPLPRWAVRYLLSQDHRAKKATLGTADLAGSWSMHYRNKTTDLPVTIDDYPYMTLLGSYGNTRNPNTGLYEAFPACAADCTDPYNEDSAHQPDFAYIPYMITGDHYYLEELHFWANFNILRLNPVYRFREMGVFSTGQTRGNAWSIRMLGRSAYITPDTHALKNYFAEKLNNNIQWFDDEYTNNSGANQLGVIAHNAAFAYNAKRGIAPWQDDFFTWSIGHIVELGFTNARPLLAWKSKFAIDRMTDASFCWISGSRYNLNIRDDTNSPVYTNIGKAYTESVDPAVAASACGGADMATEMNLDIGEMWGNSHAAYGYPSNLQPALSVIVDNAIPGAADAWNRFDSRSVKPLDYDSQPNFAIIPR